MPRRASSVGVSMPKRCTTPWRRSCRISAVFAQKQKPRRSGVSWCVERVAQAVLRHRLTRLVEPQCLDRRIDGPNQQGHVNRTPTRHAEPPERVPAVPGRDGEGGVRARRCVLGGRETGRAIAGHGFRDLRRAHQGSAGPGAARWSGAKAVQRSGSNHAANPPPWSSTRLPDGSPTSRSSSAGPSPSEATKWPK